MIPNTIKKFNLDSLLRISRKSDVFSPIACLLKENQYVVAAKCI